MDRCKDAAGDDVALDSAEPRFDLIEPRRMRRGEMHMNIRMFDQEGWTSPAFVDISQLPVCSCSNAIGLS